MHDIKYKWWVPYLFTKWKTRAGFSFTRGTIDLLETLCSARSMGNSVIFCPLKLQATCQELTIWTGQPVQSEQSRTFLKEYQTQKPLCSHRQNSRFEFELSLTDRAKSTSNLFVILDELPSNFSLQAPGKN